MGKKHEIKTYVPNQNRDLYIYDDGWMRSDFIVVSKNFKVKNLKPYQRLIVLRKPEGEVKCVVDKSLPFSEIERIQEKIQRNGHFNINSKNITRIIPHDYKVQSEKIESDPEEDIETAKLLFEVETGTNEFSKNEIGENNDANFQTNYYIFHMNNEYVVSNPLRKVVPSDQQKKVTVDDVDLIDSIRIKIPHEERSINWNTNDDEVQRFLNLEQQETETNVQDDGASSSSYYKSADVYQEENKHYEVNDESEITELENKKDEYGKKSLKEEIPSEIPKLFDSENSDMEDNSDIVHETSEDDVQTLYIDNVYNEQQNDQIVEEQQSAIDEYGNEVPPPTDVENVLSFKEEIVNELNETQPIDDNQVYLVDGENSIANEDDYMSNDYVEQQQEVVSFFKNKVDNNYEVDKPRNYYKFYKDSNPEEYEKVILNKKMNMFTFRKKIDKNLINRKKWY